MTSGEAWAIWVTGLPGSGKTMISRRVKGLLEERGVKVKILELDEIRRVITPSPTYSEAERDIVYSSLAYMAKLLTEAGVNVIIDATGNRLRYRELARSLIPNFAEVYLECPLEVCIRRERGRKARFSPRDIYEKGKERGATVPGVNVPYEEPEAPEIIADSAGMGVEEAAQKIVEGIEKLFLRRSFSTCQRENA
jgi:adenylylsulfate kinase